MGRVKQTCTKNGGSCKNASVEGFKLCAHHLQKAEEYRIKSKERLRAIKLGLEPLGKKRSRNHQSLLVPCYWCGQYFSPELPECKTCQTPYDEEKSKSWARTQALGYIDIVRKNQGQVGVQKVIKAKQLYGKTEHIELGKQIDAYLEKVGATIRPFNNKKRK